MSAMHGNATKDWDVPTWGECGLGACLLVLMLGGGSARLDTSAVGMAVAHLGKLNQTHRAGASSGRGHAMTLA